MSVDDGAENSAFDVQHDASDGPFTHPLSPLSGLAQVSTANYNVIDGVLDTRVDDEGRVQLPPKLIERFELEPGGEVLLVDVGFGLLLVSNDSRRELIEKLIPDKYK